MSAHACPSSSRAPKNSHERVFKGLYTGLELANEAMPYVAVRKHGHTLIRSKNRGQYGGIYNNSKAGSVLRANFRGDFKTES